MEVVVAAAATEAAEVVVVLVVVVAIAKAQLVKVPGSNPGRCGGRILFPRIHFLF